MSQKSCPLHDWKASIRPCLAAVVSLAGFVLGASAGEPSALAAVPSQQQSSRMPDVQIIHDLAYRDLYEGEDGSLEKNKLDVYVPRGRRDFPVIFFVHGGAWLHGNKNQ